MRARGDGRMPAVAMLVLAAVACGGSTRFEVRAPAVPPSQIGVQRTAHARVPARVVVPNFEVTQLDTQYSEADKARARTHFAVGIPNMVQEALGQYRVFSEVQRVAEADTANADFVLEGQYRHFERVGGTAGQWVPFLALFGANVNQAWVRSDLDVWLVDARSGQEVFRHTYSEEHKQTGSVYADPKVSYLQPQYVSQIATDLSAQAERLAALHPRTQEPEVAVGDRPVVRRPRPAPARTAKPRPAPPAPAARPAAPAAAARPAAPAAAPQVAPPPAEGEEMEDWAIRMRKGLTEPEP